jgi:hypothetical protein
LHELVHKQELRPIGGEAQESHQIGMPYPAHKIHLRLFAESDQPMSFEIVSGSDKHKMFNELREA